MVSVLQQIREILSYQFSIKESDIQLEAGFEIELGADSRDLIEIMAEFEEAFDIEIVYEDVYDIVTVKDALIYILSKQAARDELYSNLQ